MRFVFAPDSFKGSLTAQRVCELLQEAAAKHFPAATVDMIPVADGGEGTVAAMVQSAGGQLETVTVTGPMGQPTEASYGLLPDGETAVLEMAQASGLPLVPPAERNPLLATSYGTGQMIAHVLKAGCRKLIIGLGGSATNDGGMGMLTALGAKFLDDKRNLLKGSGGELCRVHQADLTGLMPEALEASITVMSDVTNPLLGDSGATAVYGPQKGATGPMLQSLESGMARYAKALEAAIQSPIADIPGAGAAGGMGAALVGALRARIKPGISLMLDTVNFDRRITGASLVITGEGRLDGQTVRYGKVAAGVAKRCSYRQVPVIAIAGSMAQGAEDLFLLADASIMTTVNAIMTLPQAMDNAEALLLSAADRMFRMLKIGRGL